LPSRKSQHKKNKKELAPLYTYIKQTERSRKMTYERFLEYESEELQIPKDVLAGQPLIRMSGNHSMILTGTYQMEEYTKEQIKLAVKKQAVLIQGEQLTIQYFRKEEVKIVGNIQNLSFIR